MAELTLQSKLTALKGVGKKTAELLKKRDLTTVEDLLFHLPVRYEDRSHIRLISELCIGQSAVLVGHVRSVRTSFGRKRTTRCIFSDESAELPVLFFNLYPNQLNILEKAEKIQIYGELKEGAGGAQLVHPEFSEYKHFEPQSFYTPVYPTTEGLGQKSLLKLSAAALQVLLLQSPEELLPEKWQQPGQSLALALMHLHRPSVKIPIEELEQSLQNDQQRIAREELLAHAIGMRLRKEAAQSLTAPTMAKSSMLWQQIEQQLPFTPTAAQYRVIKQIRSDLVNDHPMQRLVQGDVGSGKTLVAAATAALAIGDGYQVAILAPTEILARQHEKVLGNWFLQQGIQTSWLSGKVIGKQREKALKEIADGSPLVIGTHALLEDHVHFKNLGLVVVDEQHRFGVSQRMALLERRNDNKVPHQLVMTATPIPRTLAMTAYSNLDISIIDELPPGRKQTKTIALSNRRRQEIIDRIVSSCLKGHQAYWVCTLVEESEVLSAEAAEKTYETLVDALPQLKLGLIHGRMKAAEKEHIMQNFHRGDIHLLVATTVIEVGVDAPSANLMVIENPERLGLSQLHQLRGRVGRGQEEGTCVLLYQTPLSENARQRIDMMRQTTDGFEIADYDLKLRGPGEILGTRQTGALQFKMADIDLHQQLISEARDMAEEYIHSHPEQSDKLLKRWLPEGGAFGIVA
ncbi:MAG: ATP-dependent DNA helicase RecG [bacterium]